MVSLFLTWLDISYQTIFSIEVFLRFSFSLCSVWHKIHFHQMKDTRYKVCVFYSSDKPFLRCTFYLKQKSFNRRFLLDKLLFSSLSIDKQSPNCCTVAFPSWFKAQSIKKRNQIVLNWFGIEYSYSILALLKRYFIEINFETTGHKNRFKILELIRSLI